MSVALLDPGQPTIQPTEPSQPLQMSYEAWRAWAPENQQTEWVAGEVIEFMPPKRLHQVLVSFLNRVIGLFVEIFELGQLQIAPFEVRIRPDGTGPQNQMPCARWPR